MTTTTTSPRLVLADAASRTARLDQLRALLADRNWSAQVVRLAADERAERISDYALEG